MNNQNITAKDEKETMTATAEQVAAQAIADLLTLLSVEQRAALESKFNSLPIEVRSAASAKYPGRKTVELYIIRQMVREANSKLASNNRPIWYNKLMLNAASLKSGDENVRVYAEKELRSLAEELDSKESSTLLKKYKNAHDLTTESPAIKQLAGIFGVEPVALK